MKNVTFAPRSEFAHALAAAVENHFIETGKSPHADRSMVLKTLSVITLFVSSYLLLLFKADSFWETAILTFLLAQAVVMIGFSIMHDSNHGSYSGNAKINRLLGYSMDLVGGSSLLWCQKHNYLHHSYTNIDQMDDDIQTEGFIRLSPHQPWKPIHRFQHLYAPFLYMIMSIHWFLFNDFRQIVTGKIGGYRIRGLNRRSIAVTLLFKLFYLTYMIVIPLQFHSPAAVLGLFLMIHLIGGFTLSVIFQLAHTVEISNFPEPDNHGSLVDEFTVHQLKTTVDFAHNNRFLTWYLGGLNYQVEHHLFPKICHVHYPAISKIVEQTCHDFGVPYQVEPSFFKALSSHFRFLKTLSQN